MLIILFMQTIFGNASLPIRVLQIALKITQADFFISSWMTTMYTLS